MHADMQREEYNAKRRDERAKKRSGAVPVVAVGAQGGSALEGTHYHPYGDHITDGNVSSGEESEEFVVSEGEADSQMDSNVSALRQRISEWQMSGECAGSVAGE